jgi:hypothetical protein
MARRVRDAVGLEAAEAMKDNPNEIADHLVEEHGLEGAVAVVADGIADAHSSGSLYDLSIWREVRKILNDR